MPHIYHGAYCGNKGFAAIRNCVEFCFTIGHRWVSRVIRWANDRFTIEMPVISVILVIMIVLAQFTHFIGVHTVLGAFVAGIMVGQSPILTKHIEEQLRTNYAAGLTPLLNAGRMTLYRALQRAA